MPRPLSVVAVKANKTNCAPTPGLYWTVLFNTTPFPHSAQMKASMDENPGKTYIAPQ